MNKINFIRGKNLSDYRHGFFSKKGGVSKGVYDSLNCGYSSKDSKSNILQNRNIVSNTLGLNNSSIIVPNQTHSNKIKIFNKDDNNLDCDGLINFSSEYAVGILTADCCPVLVGHKDHIFSGCLHIGWKGLYSGIILNFLQLLFKKNIKPEELIVSLGPCIGKDSYRISNDFRKMFIENSYESKAFFLFKEKNNSFYFDLKGYIERIFNTYGIQNVWKSNKDTYKNADMFFSYRYACHNDFNDYGRMLSVIGNN